MKATRSDIATARREVEFANSEINRWGMLLASLTETRSDLRRGVAGDDAGDDAYTRFSRIVTGYPDGTPAERRSDLRYLDVETIREGPGSGGTFFAFAGTLSWMGSFTSAFRSYVTGGSGGPAPAEVANGFSAEALGPALDGYDSDPSKFDDLVDFAEAGLRAAKAHREDAIDRLNNEFDEDGTRVAAGLVQNYHERADVPEGGDVTADALGDMYADRTGTDSNHLAEYERLVRGLDELPAVLLPVGLETRFLGTEDDRTGDGAELWVRVYPDDVHVDAHEEELTPQEERWGKVFWTQVYVARFPAKSDPDLDPKDRFEVDVEAKIPDDPVAQEQLRLLFYDNGEGTTLDDFSDRTSERYREIKERAWGMLVERAGRERAAYVAHRTAPVDHSEPNESETAVEVLSGSLLDVSIDPGADSQAPGVDPLEFPGVEHRPGSWTKQPRAKFLPDRWLAFVEWTEDGEQRSATVAAPHTVREPLYMGPNPEAVAASKDDADAAGRGSDDGDSTPEPSSTKEAVADGMEWMVDFEEAERAGMGFRVTAADLGTETLPDEFDRVTVTGLKASMDAEASREALSELLEVHHYTRGLEVLPEGMPTNNHEGESGYRSSTDHVDTVDTEVGAPLTGPGDVTDGNLLSAILGLGQPEGEDHPFAHVEGADQFDWFDAYHVNSVLWPGTLGHYLRHLLTPNKYLTGQWSQSDLDSETELLAGVREHFLRYVRGGGPLPALRVGNQPYGVLPATSLDDHGGGTESEDSVYRLLLEAVKWFRRFWEGSLDNVNRVNPERAADGVGSGGMYVNVDWGSLEIEPASGGNDKSDRRSDGGKKKRIPDSDSNEEEGDEEEGPRNTVEAVLEQDAISNTFKHRPYYLEYQQRGYQYFGAYEELVELGLDFEPRIGRLSHFDVMANRSRFPYFDMVAGRSELDPIADAVSASDTYLDRISRVSTGDLVRLGYDFNTRRFEYLFSDVYAKGDGIGSWNDLSELFDWTRLALLGWAASGDKNRYMTRLEALFDLTDPDEFVVTMAFEGTEEPDLPPSGPVAKSVLEDVLDASFDDDARNIAGLHILVVDALDAWLGRGNDYTRIEMTGGRLMGESVQVNTKFQDGHERLHPDLEHMMLSLRRDLMERARNLEHDWPDGRSEFEELFYSLTEAVLQHSDRTYGAFAGDVTMRDFRSDILGPMEYTEHGGIIEVQGQVFDVSGPEIGHPNSALDDAIEWHNNYIFNAAWGILWNLIGEHTEDYLTLAYTFKSDDVDAPLQDWSGFRVPGASAVPVGDVAPLETKANRDTSLFDLVVWYSVMNANLNVIGRHDDVDPSEFLIGDQGEENEPTVYDLLDRETPSELRRALGWTDSGTDHEIATEFGGHRWFGLLDAMRSEEYVGHDGTDDRFAAFQASLRWMAKYGFLSRGRVERTGEMFATTLDLASHRLDAWWTSLATRRLSEIRSGPEFDLVNLDMAEAWSEAPTDSENGDDASGKTYELDTDAPVLAQPDGENGSYIGAYGFVENLERDYHEARTEYEYLQAHSVSHARTAAILRSGYRSNPDEEFTEKLKVDLSPRRVSMAKSVMEGLREGLWLGEILGYFFERRLHEVSERTLNVNLEQYIADFREYKPLSEGKVDRGDGGGGDEDPGRRMNVVDGYALYRTATKQGLNHVYSAVGVDHGHDELRGIFEDMEAIIDAVADVLTAENVHQLQQGNYSQAGRSVAALAEGKVPSEPEITRTQRDHVGVTHRMLVLTGLGDGGTGDGLTPPSEWQPGGTITTPKIAPDGSVELDDGDPVTTSEEFLVRNEGAPVVNELAGRLFPDPSEVYCTAAYRWTTDPEDGSETEHEVETSATLADLRLSPVDALSLTQRTGEAGASKLESHVAYHLMRDRPDDGSVPNDATVAIEFESVPDSAPEDALSFGDFIELSRSLRDLVSEGRPADATDFAHPGEDPDPGQDEGALKQRAEDAETVLENVGSVLANRLSVFGSDGGKGSDLESFLDESKTNGKTPASSGGKPAKGGGNGGDGSGGNGGGNGSSGNGSGSNGGSGNGSGGNGGSGNGNGSGGNAGGSDGDSGGSKFDDLTEDADEVAEALSEFAPEAHLGSVDRELDHLSGSTFLQELEKVEERLPAGPTDPSEVDRELAVAAEPTTVEGDVPTGGDADGFIPPVSVTFDGRIGEGGFVERLILVAPDGQEIASLPVGEGGDTFSATHDFDGFLSGREPLREVTVRIDGTDAELRQVSADDLVVDLDGSDPVELTVARPALVESFREGGLTLTVAVESQSPASRFSESVTGVAVDGDGGYEAEIDFSAARPGTPFQLVALAEGGSEAPVLDTRQGRVVGGSGSLEGIDDEFVKSLTVVPRLLWLEANVDAFFPFEVDPDSVDDSKDSGGSAPPATAIGATTSAQVTGEALPYETVRTSFQPKTLSLRAPTDQGGSDADSGGDGDTGQGPDLGTVRDLSDPTATDTTIEMDALPVVDPKAGEDRPDGSGSPGSLPAETGGKPIDLRTRPTAAGRLGDAIEAADWTAIEREFALVPESRTTFDSAERTAVKSLIALQDVDMEAVSAALTGVEDTRGIVTTTRKVGLPGAITTVGTDAPFSIDGSNGSDDQTFYEATDPAALADARARIRAFTRDPWPSTERWQSDELGLVDGDLVAFVRDRGIEDEFGVLLSVVTDPAWNVSTLSAMSDAPHEVVRAVDDALYHPDEVGPNGYERAGDRLLAVANAAGTAASDPAMRERLLAFDNVDDVDADFGSPLATVARTLRAFDGGGDDGGSRRKFVDAFDDAVGTLSEDLGLLRTAHAGHDVADAFREGLLETLRRPMLRAAYFGIYGAVPAEASGGSKTVARNLVRQAEDVLGSVRSRLDAYSGVTAADPVEREEERLKALFGEDLQVLPPFSPPNAREIGRTFGDDGLTDHDDAGPLPVETWFQRSSRVRERARMLRESLTYADTVNDATLLDLDVGQLPYYPDDDWVGIDGARPNESDRVSLVAHTDDGFDRMVSSKTGSDPRFAGLFVDEWVEQYPSEEETTAVSFRYDDPGNRPPQSILLAAPPKGEGAWSLSTLEGTVGETMDMMKYRAVDLESLKPEDATERVAIGHLLPALMFAKDTHVQPNHPELDFTPLEQYGNYLEQLSHMNLINQFGNPRLDPDVRDAIGSSDFTGGLGGDD